MGFVIIYWFQLWWVFISLPYFEVIHIINTLQSTYEHPFYLIVYVPGFALKWIFSKYGTVNQVNFDKKIKTGVYNTRYKKSLGHIKIKSSAHFCYQHPIWCGWRDLNADMYKCCFILLGFFDRILMSTEIVPHKLSCRYACLTDKKGVLRLFCSYY